MLRNGEPKLFSPMASTLISGSEDAVLTDPGMTIDQAHTLGDWVASRDRNLTDIFVTHGHGDHWFAVGLLAERFGARVVASAETIAQMQRSAAARPLLWDKVYTGIPPTAVTAVTVPDNRFTLEGHQLVIVEVGNTDSEDTTVLHVPDLELVVAGDVIYNGVHMYLAQPAIEGSFGPWRAAINKIGARHTRIRAGRPQTNGHVERLHRTILEECWRPAFARFLQPRYRGLERELDAYLDIYNFHRAHTGPITQGRAPAELVYGATKMEPR